ncbi:MAG: hypothetical protein JEZ09_20325 [Salinivirgaceae bacterium]|nr:hypothetical protein [Salinivirgaceae bacterium]
MENTSLPWFFKKLQNDNQCLLYNGSFSDKITYKIVRLNEASLKNHKENFVTQKRVSYLMAECFQNIVRHGDDTLEEDISDQKANFFMTRNSMGKYYILSGNLIKDENINKLKTQIDQLNKLSEDELKDLFKYVMKYGKISDKGGAGLGLIEMARKSGHKLGYSFKKYNNDNSIFYNQIVLKSAVEPDESNEDNMRKIESAIEFHNLLIKNNILMVQKGDFSQESILPVLNIIERSIIKKNTNTMAMRHLYRVMVELLQNISRHAFTENQFKEGIFSLSKINDRFVVSTGNYILNSHIEFLDNHLNKINSLDNDQLENWYSELLMEGLETENDDTGLGLIDLSQILKNKIEFAFETIDEVKTFFTINVTI